jgi:hypothetical protein
VNPGGSVTSKAAVVNVLPKLWTQPNGKNLTLTWPGPFVLQSATVPAGPFTDLPAASSPYTNNTTTSANKFFRLRSQPYDVAMTPLANKQVSLNLTGPPGCMFEIQASSDLFHWVSLQTNSAPASFVDTTAANYPIRYYRAVLAK